MKIILLFILFTCNTLYSQTNTISDTSKNQIDNYKPILKNLKDENGNNIINFSGLDSIIFIYGESTSNHLGISVSSAGDVNGDGYSDVIVGADLYNNNAGRAYIFFGGAFMDNIADVTLNGLGGNFGVSVSTAGDVNGDGYSDVIVGADKFEDNSGRAYIFYGGINMDNTVDLTLPVGGGNFGNAVSAAGDVNGDGYSDVIVGAYKYNGYGRAYVFFGGNNMNNIPDVIIDGDILGGGIFGNAVSTAGDVNGDGYSDILIGNWGYSGNTGKAYIFYGGIIMNNVVDITMTGTALNDQFGISVSTAGDINGDSFSDIIIGASGFGKAFIFYGSSAMDNNADKILVGNPIGNYFGVSVSTAGDINGDGFTDVIVGATGFNSFTGQAFIFFGGMDMNTDYDILLTCESMGSLFGYSVSYAGDIDGDGFPNVIVGAMDYNGSTGRAYLFVSLLQRPQLINPVNNSLNNPLNINFRWNKINTALYYVLNISTDSAFNNIILRDTIYTDTFKTVSGFQKGTKYYWKIVTKDSTGIIISSLISNYKTVPSIIVKLNVLMEGMYFPIFNQMTRKDTIKVYLRNASPPFALVDSSTGTIDPVSLFGQFNFNNASSGVYYLIIKHFNCIETWSKAGGENILLDGTVYNYDFTTSNTKAYGNNLKLKGGKYCIYSGDVNQNGFISLSDVLYIYNDIGNFVTGGVESDLTGDNLVDLNDLMIAYTNTTNFIRKRTP